MRKSSKGRVEIQITNVDPSVKEHLKAIAKFQGVTASQLLRPVLREVCAKYPSIEDLKKFNQ